MHDYFDILGVSRNARPTEIRRACCRRVRATHPDIWDGDTPPAPGRMPARANELQRPGDLSEAAIDFVDASMLVDAMRAAFFATGVRQKA